MSISAPTLLIIGAILSCGAPPVAPAGLPLPAPPPNSPDVTGWEGFFDPAGLTDTWLDDRTIPMRAAPLLAVRLRVGKLVIANGARSMPEADLLAMYNRSCHETTARAWSVDRCAAIEARECADGLCTYQHFGNCSGVVIDGGVFLTAAHCVADLVGSEERRERSAILLPDDTGNLYHRTDVGGIELGKADFGHHWVALDDANPVDVAAIAVPDTGFTPMAVADLPSVGQPVAIMGFPRVEGRSEAARTAADYTARHGVPSVSFGRVADQNTTERPLCNVDGMQEHWALTAPCPTGEIMVDGDQTWTGPITNRPFLATYDSLNGYSGAPVFNAQGELVGINATLISDTNPQDAFVPHARMVATPIRPAFERLGLPE